MSTKATVGRIISIAGHPFVLVPVAILIATSGQSASARGWALGSVVAAMAVLSAYVVRRQRRGDFTDVDVSKREQRPAVYALAIVTLVATGIALHIRGSNPIAVRGVTLAAGLFAVSALVNVRLKASLHCAFAVLAAGIAWPSSMLAAMSFAFVAVAVAWGRVAYGRHARSEVVVGLGLGALAAIAFVGWSSST